MTFSREKFKETVAAIKNNSIQRISLNNFFTAESFARATPHITDIDLFEIAAAIKLNRSLKHFGLDSNVATQWYFSGWTEDGVSAIGDALKDHPGIQSLSVDYTHCISATSVDRRTCLGLFNALTGTANIKSLSLVGILGSNFLNVLAEFLKCSHSLEEIKLSTYSIYPLQYWTDFAKSLANKRLISLNIQNESLQDKGLAELAPILSQMRFLEKLELVDCNLSSESANSFASILSNTTKLKTLRLAKNPLGNAVVTFLKAGKSGLTHLEELDLSYTGFDIVGFHALAEILSELHLQSLNVRQVNSNADHFHPIKKILKSCPTLRDFTVYLWHPMFYLSSTLADTQKCKLRTFNFGVDVAAMDVSSILALTQIMFANPYLLTITPQILPNSPNNTHRQKVMRQRAIDYMVLLAGILLNEPDYSKVHSCSIHDLPRELRLEIAKMVLPVFMDINLFALWNLLLTSAN